MDADEESGEYELAEDEQPQPRARAAAGAGGPRWRDTDEMLDAIEAGTFGPSRNSGLRPSFWHHLRSYPQNHIYCAVGILLNFAAALVVHPSAWLGVTVWVFFYWLLWTKLRRFYSVTALGAGIVISTRPLVVACTSDLSVGEGSWPVLKLFRSPSWTFQGRRPEVNDRVPLAYTYAVGDEHAWRDFDAKPWPCLSGKEERVGDLMQKLDDADWQEISDFLKRVPQPVKVTTYFLNRPGFVDRRDHGPTPERSQLVVLATLLVLTLAVPIVMRLVF